MIDKITEKDVKFGSLDNKKWYEEHVLSKEQLDLLIKNKFDRYKNYQINKVDC
jgi:hypothetical protein